MSGLRERKKLKLANQLTEAALALFIARGFEATTINDIVAAVDVSARTFFRYFDSKEDVIVGFADRQGEELCALVAARPREEPPLTAIHRGLAALVARYDAQRDFALALLRLMNDTPAIRARHLDKQDGWQRGLAQEVARRLGIRSARDLRPRLIAGVALTTLDAAVAAWLASNGRTSLARLLDDAFGAVSGGLDRGSARRAPARPRRRAPTAVGRRRR